MNVRYRLELSQIERAELVGLLSAGKLAVRKLKRAQILLAADGGASDAEIARNVAVGGSTVYRTTRRFVLANLEAALSEAPRPGASRMWSGKAEALLVVTVKYAPGRARWTLELLAGELVRLTRGRPASCASASTSRCRTRSAASSPRSTPARTPGSGALLLTAIFTGLRISELRGLRWDDVDLKRSELHVRQRADRYNAMGQAQVGAASASSRYRPRWSTRSAHGSLPVRTASRVSHFQRRTAASRTT